VNMSCSIN